MTATRTPERPAEPFPSLPLEPVRHQQVRALLVREAGTPQRHPAVRWAVPAGVGALAAAVAGAVALGGGQLLGADGRGDPAVVPDQVDCSLGIVPGDVEDVPDGWRLMSDAPGDLVVTNSVRLEPTTCPGQPAGQSTGRAVQAFATLAPDGTVTAAVTVWADAPARADGTEPVVVRGVPGAVQVGTSQYGTERVWWSEAGQDRSVSSSGLDRAALLALVERAGPDGVLPEAALPAGLTPLPFEQPDALEPYEPEWSADYSVPGAGTGPEQEPDGIGVRVSRTQQPWQTELSQWVLDDGVAPRVVDVDGRPGVLFSNGGPDLWLRYSLDDGVQVFVGGLGDELTGGSLAFAGTLVPVAADDPRIRELDWDAVLSTESP